MPLFCEAHGALVLIGPIVGVAPGSRVAKAARMKSDTGSPFDTETILHLFLDSLFLCALLGFSILGCRFRYIFNGLAAFACASLPFVYFETVFSAPYVAFGLLVVLSLLYGYLFQTSPHTLPLILGVAGGTCLASTLLCNQFMLDHVWFSLMTAYSTSAITVIWVLWALGGAAGLAFAMLYEHLSVLIFSATFGAKLFALILGEKTAQHALHHPMSHLQETVLFGVVSVLGLATQAILGNHRHPKDKPISTGVVRPQAAVEEPEIPVEEPEAAIKEPETIVGEHEAVVEEPQAVVEEPEVADVEPGPANDTEVDCAGSSRRPS